ncbi:periplasmic protein [Thiorhodovibrio winogradskyi]|uniref:Periplasmic protein n=1 Tax=Thiorhodovibrio winogradskyi TaxID=77007 RepID=A0ABZ0SEX8_9GAMM|nr:BON domain-containing protein [Thiorhodovibrio winogradskyi]
MILSSVHRRRHLLIQTLAGVVLLALLVATATSAEAPDVRAAQAQMLMRINPLLDGYEIRVIPFPNKWRLEGAVANAIEADLARELAELMAKDDTKIVDALDRDAAIPEDSGTLIDDVSDRTTAARLRQRLRWQTRNSPLDVSVEVDKGMARLHGQVGAASTKDRLAAMAVSTLGVDEVFNYISVDPALIPKEREAQRRAEAEKVEDAWIQARLHLLMTSDTRVNARAIDMAVENGQVILSGSVTSVAERNVAESLAKYMPGVQELDSHLVIERQL